MNVLWVTPGFPDAKGSGGRVHEWELLRTVVRNNTITLFAGSWDIRPEALEAVRSLGVRVQVIPWLSSIRPRTRVRRLFGLLLGAGPTSIVSSYHRRLKPIADAIRAEVAERPVDLVTVFLGDLAPVVGASDTPTALMLFDIYARQTELMERGFSKRAIRHRLERRNASRWEAKHYARAEGVACVSPIDAELASRMIGRPVDFIPNPIPDEFFDLPKVPRSPATVAFVGGFGWEPNVDSARWLVREIWPRIKEQRPDARLRIAGRGALADLQREVEDAGGEFLSDVDDIRTVYWDAAVLCASVRMGSGTRNKVLHAMACGAPVVSTPSALEGIEARDGEHLLVADDAAGLARAVLATLDDRDAAARRASAASRDIAARYSSAGAGAALEAWWAKTAAARAVRSRPTTAPQQALAPPATASIVVRQVTGTDELVRCLKTVEVAASAVEGTEVLVVAGDGTAAAAACRDAGVDATVVTELGKGGSPSRNAGARRGSGKMILFTDGDCEVPADWVSAHREALSDPGVAASFGPAHGDWSIDEDSDPLAAPMRHRPGSPPWLVGVGANAAVRRSAFEAIGGFDERLDPPLERGAGAADADLIMRLLAKGSISSGVGRPVRRISPPSAPDGPEILTEDAYRAGTWIGKLLRSEPRLGVTMLRARVGHIRDYATFTRATGKRPVQPAALGRAFLRGVSRGLRLRAKAR